MRQSVIRSLPIAPLLAVVGVAVLVTLLQSLGAFRFAEAFTQAWRISLTTDPDSPLAPEPDDSPVVVFGIDDATLDRFGEWSSWDRSRIARVVYELERLRSPEGESAVVALDLLVIAPTTPEHDERLANAVRGHVIAGRVSGPNAVLPMFAQSAAAVGAVAFPPDLAQPVLIRRPASDGVATPIFAEAAAETVVAWRSARSPGYGRTFYDGQPPAIIPWPDPARITDSPWRLGGPGASAGPPLPGADRIATYSLAPVVELAEIRHQRQSIADLLIPPPPTEPGVIPPVRSPDLMRQALDEQARFVLEQLETVPVAQRTDEERRLGGAARWWLEERPAADARIDSLGAELARLAGGKLVFVGWTATGAAADTVPTPLGPRTPGVMVHAAYAQGLFQGARWNEPPDVASLAVTFALCLLAGLCAVRWHGLRGALGVLALVAFSLGGAVFSAADAGLLWPIAGPIVGMILCPAFGAAVALGVTRRQRDAARRVLRGRVSPDVERKLLADPAALVLPAERRLVTVAFFDLVGFSATVERLGDANVAFLVNDAMNVIARHVRDSGGYVNKFLGDGLMAVWNAPAERPDHPAAAARAALGAARELKSRWGEPLSRGERTDGPDATIDPPSSPLRVGLATGPAQVGDFGAPPDLVDYTAIGPTVNDAAHLEKAAKALGVWCLLTDENDAIDDESEQGRRVSETPHEVPAARTSAFASGLDERAVLRPVGPVLLPGRTRPRRVFTIVEAEQIDAADASAAALALLAGGRPSAAGDAFRTLAEKRDDSLAYAWLDAIERGEACLRLP